MTDTITLSRVRRARFYLATIMRERDDGLGQRALDLYKRLEADEARLDDDRAVWERAISLTPAEAK